jgi:hypothetical protein
MMEHKQLRDCGESEDIMSERKSDNSPTKEVLAELHRNPGGLSASALADKVAGQGYPLRDVQRAIRRAIDKGAVIVGGHLELLASEDS